MKTTCHAHDLWLATKDVTGNGIQQKNCSIAGNKYKQAAKFKVSHRTRKVNKKLEKLYNYHKQELAETSQTTLTWYVILAFCLWEIIIEANHFSEMQVLKLGWNCYTG